MSRDSHKDLPTVKREVKRQFENLPGVEGFGVGDGVINVYVSNPEICSKIPATFQGIPLNLIKTGIIEALEVKNPE
jgi:hypothetical protein